MKDLFSNKTFFFYFTNINAITSVNEYHKIHIRQMQLQELFSDSDNGSIYAHD